jgi:hypothetical protein
MTLALLSDRTTSKDEVKQKLTIQPEMAGEAFRDGFLGGGR